MTIERSDDAKEEIARAQWMTEGEEIKPKPGFDTRTALDYETPAEFAEWYVESDYEYDSSQFPPGVEWEELEKDWSLDEELQNGELERTMELEREGLFHVYSNSHTMHSNRYNFYAHFNHRLTARIGIALEVPMCKYQLDIHDSRWLESIHTYETDWFPEPESVVEILCDELGEQDVKVTRHQVRETLERETGMFSYIEDRKQEGWVPVQREKSEEAR